jgi:hypothetical protein
MSVVNASNKPGNTNVVEQVFDVPVIRISPSHEKDDENDDENQDDSSSSYVHCSDSFPRWFAYS